TGSFKALIPLRPALLAGLLALPSIGIAESPRVGGVAIGNDPLATGAMQTALDARLGAIAGLSPQGAASLAGTIGKTTPAAPVEIDLKIFPPSVKEIADAIRPHLPMVTVTLGGLPPGASPRIDDRPVERVSRVPAGSHVLTSTAPGFRAVRSPFDAASDATISV